MVSRDPDRGSDEVVKVVRCTEQRDRMRFVIDEAAGLEQGCPSDSFMGMTRPIDARVNSYGLCWIGVLADCIFEDYVADLTRKK